MTTTWVGLGSNLGESVKCLEAAFGELDALAQTRLLRRSRLYKTAPWGVTDQPDFINAVAELTTTLAPEALLDALLAIEARHGRERREHWGPRTLDLDLLLYGAERITTERLQVPHPHLGERAFVLVPLAELEPALEIPGSDTVSRLLATVDASDVEVVST